MQRFRAESAIRSFEHTLRSFYGCFEVAPTGATDSHGQLEPATYGPFEGCIVAASSLRCSRPALSDRWADRAFLLASLSGELVLEHHDRNTRIGAGDLALLDSRAPCTLIAHASTRCVALAIDRAMVEDAPRGRAAPFGTRLGWRGGSEMLLSGLIGALVNAGTSFDVRECSVALDVTARLLDAITGGQEDVRRAKCSVSIIKGTVGNFGCGRA